MLAASGSARLSALVAVVSSAPLVRRVLHGYSDDDRRRSVVAHRDIITAIENGDEHLATSAMSGHILAARYSALAPPALTPRTTPRPPEDTVLPDRRHTLRRFPVVTTTSLEEAREAVTDVYLPHALQAEAPLRMQLNAARQKRFTLGFLAYGARSELRMPPTETTYHINLTTSGRTFAERGDGTRAVTEARASGVVLLPNQLNTVRWTDDAEQLILKIPRTRLESHLADLIGSPVTRPVDFTFGFSTASPAGRSLLASVEFLARELDRDGGIAEMPLAREQLEAFVMTQVLLAVPNSYTDRLTGYVTRAPPLPAAAGARPHGRPRGPAAYSRRARPGGLHERPGAPRLLPARAGRVADGAPAQDQVGPCTRRPAAMRRSAHAHQRCRDAVGVLPPEQVRQAVPRAVRGASLRHGRPITRSVRPDPRTSRSYFSRSPPHLQGWPC